LIACYTKTHEGIEPKKMFEQTVAIATKDGEMESYAFCPDEGGSYPAVILYMDAPGIREELHDFCRRIAAQGLYVLLPDMYYRLGKMRFDAKQMADPTTGVREKMFDAMNSLTNQLVMDDTQGMLDFMSADSRVKDGPKGCIGYCMSGRYVVSAAGTYPEQFKAVASLYGVGIVTDENDSPHLLAEKIKAELYFGFADTDPYVPDNVIPDLKVALDGHGVSYKLDVWPETEHGFCFPSRPIYKEDSAEKVWKIVFDLFQRTLS